MKRVVNKEELRVEWKLTSLGEKALYVLGWGSFIYLAVCFTVGFIVGVVEVVNY